MCIRDRRRGDLLVDFDMEGIRAEGYELITPVVVTNTDAYEAVLPGKTGQVSLEDEVLEVVER